MGYDWGPRTYANIVAGGVQFTVVDTNPQYGGADVAGTRTFTDVLAGEVPTCVDATELPAIQARVRRVLDALAALLAAVKMIGEANDAIDHGAHESADALFTSAPVRAREAWALAPHDLATLLPALAPLAAGQLDISRWWQYADAIEAARKGVG